MMINRKILGLLAPAALLAPATAMAQGLAQGSWIVTGQIDGKPVSVECSFGVQGSALGGRCTDIIKGDRPKLGKVHELSRGSVGGNKVRWTCPVKVMIMSIDINFDGTINGNRMSGTIEAKGRHGQFSAIRKAP